MIGEEAIRAHITEIIQKQTGPGWKVRSIARYTILQRSLWVAIAECEDGELQEGVFTVGIHGEIGWEQPIYRADQYLAETP